MVDPNFNPNFAQQENVAAVTPAASSIAAPTATATPALTEAEMNNPNADYFTNLAKSLVTAGAQPQTAATIANATPQPSASNPTSLAPANLSTILGNNATTPNPQSVIPVSNLSTPANPSSSVASSLQNITGASPTNTTDSSLAGILSLYNQPNSGDQAYKSLSDELSSLQTSLGNEGADTTSALNQEGVPAMTQAVNNLNLTVAQQQGQLAAFDAETQQGLSNLEGQQIPQGLVQGQQAQYQKQRDLTKLSMTAELTANTALIQAYNGNIDTATKLATQAVTLKYQPITAQITALQSQLAAAKDTMSSDDSKQAAIVSALLDYQKTQIATQQDNENKIQTLAVTAASNGAPIAVVNAIKNSSDPTSAAQAGAKYLGSTSPLYNGGSSSSSTTFTKTQLNNGAANAGLGISDFNGLDSDVQNFFINSAPQVKTFDGLLSGVQTGKQDLQSAIDTVNQSTTLSPGVKKYLIEQLQKAQPAGSSGGSVLGNVGNFLKGAAGNVLNFLGL